MAINLYEKLLIDNYTIKTFRDLLKMQFTIKTLRNSLKMQTHRSLCALKQQVASLIST